MLKDKIPHNIYNILSWIIHPLIRYNGMIEEKKRKSQWMNYIKSAPELHKEALKRLKSKEGKINCVFFALYDSVWKYDGVYKLLSNDSRFNVTVLICPIVNYGKKHMEDEMERCFKTMSQKGYHTIRAYNKQNNSYIDVKKELQPDIIFYTNPYKGLIDDRYYIDQFPDILTVYVQYAYNISIWHNNNYSAIFHNLLWRYYQESELHLQFAIKYSQNAGKNAIVTGYPGIDNLIDKKYKPKVIWKTKDKKRIIWAPHHTIEPADIIDFSCFLHYYDYMINIAKKYQNHIELIFKPHPLLKVKLVKKWGQEKTDEYYNLWKTMPNTMVQTGEYLDLFLTSDAMIHDSGSFLIEYLYTNKPVMRTMNNVNPQRIFNEIGLRALDVYYKGYNEDDIEQFIKNVIAGVDPLKEKREKFLRDHLLPPNGKMPSENIVNDIIDSIDNQRV